MFDEDLPSNEGVVMEITGTYPSKGYMLYIPHQGLHVLHTPPRATCYTYPTKGYMLYIPHQGLHIIHTVYSRIQSALFFADFLNE